MRGEPLETHTQHAHMFYEFHNYEYKNTYQYRVLMLIFANLAGTLFTNPFDVVLSKMAT